MASFNLPPIPIILYTILAIASSSIWLTSFILEILHHPGTIFLLPATLAAVYITHLIAALALPICSRPWLIKTDSKRSLNFTEIFMILMGWDNHDGEHWAVGGARGVAAFLVGVSPFLMPIEKSPWGLAAIVALASESFFLAEVVKHTEMEEGVFYAMMSSAVCASRRVFGYDSRELVAVLAVCLVFVFMHSLLPFYDDEEFVDVEPKPDCYGAAEDGEGRPKEVISEVVV